jgi:hypothetical protein
MPITNGEVSQKLMTASAEIHVPGWNRWRNTLLYGVKAEWSCIRVG